MKRTREILNCEDKSSRLGICDTGEAAVVVADIPTGRTSTFTFQILTKKNPEFAPFLHTEEVEGPTKGSRHALVITTQGVRRFLESLRNTKAQGKNHEPKERAKQWIEQELLPEMEAMEATVGRPKGMLVGKPSSKLKGSIAIKIGSISFSGDFLDPDTDTISVTRGKLLRTWTASQLIEVMEHHRF
jgi:hypothetical protein